MKRPANPDVMKPSDWFVRPRSEMVAKREDVWALLGWYHAKYVKPQLGIAGVFRRLWWRVSGQSRKLLSPWEELHDVIERRKAARSLAHDINRGDGSGASGLDLDEESEQRLGTNGDGARRIIVEP